MTTTTWGFSQFRCHAHTAVTCFLMKLSYSSSAGEHIEFRLKVLLSLLLSL